MCYYSGMKLVVGLGNPGEKYINTRHNTGRIVVGLVESKIGENKIKFITPEVFMNNSGKAVAPLIKSKKDLKDLVVIYDDIDLPIGKIKISFNRSSGGHNGLNSVIKALKSEEFVRIRVGISPSKKSARGGLAVARKPKGEKAVLEFLLGKFKDSELETIKKLSKKVGEAVTTIFSEGREKAMSLYN